MAKRRSEREQRRIVAAWVRSGASAPAFAAKEGVSEASLFRWARLHRLDASSSRGVEFVQAMPMGTEDAGPWVWELETPRGVLRGRDELDGDRVRALVGALVGASR